MPYHANVESSLKMENDFRKHIYSLVNIFVYTTVHSKNDFSLVVLYKFFIYDIKLSC